jgi:hypothetical protein
VRCVTPGTYSMTGTDLLGIYNLVVFAFAVSNNSGYIGHLSTSICDSGNCIIIQKVIIALKSLWTAWGSQAYALSIIQSRSLQ